MEHIDVVIVGAGLAGIGAACHLRMDGAGHSFVLLEGRPKLGGTWDLFRYPGIRSDSDMYTYGFRFKPWKRKKDIASGESILEYLNETVDEFQLRDRIRLGQRVECVEWSSQDRRWLVTTVRVEDGHRTRISCKFLMTCTGYYNYARGHSPTFEGLADYEGTVVHPQFWPPGLDYEGKRVLVIGSGATAVTLVPAMAGVARHVTMLQRSPAFMFSRPAEDRAALALRRVLPSRFAYAAIRAKNIVIQRGQYAYARARPAKVRQLLQERTAKAVGPAVDVDRHFNPKYEPWDQRLCLMPDGDFFRCLREGSASIVTDSIQKFDRKGVVLRSGRQLAADIVVTATGLEVQFLGGIEMKVDGQQVDVGKLVTYKGVMFGGVPNWAAMVGYTSASWTLRSELVSRYVCRLLRHMRQGGYDTVVPELDARATAARPFMAKLSSGYLQRGAGLVPKQSDSGPWVNPDDYVKDLFLLRWGRLGDGVLHFGKAPRRDRLALGGKTIVLTGAASGIGAELARQLAARGCHLALVDLRREPLYAVAEEARQAGVQVSTHVVDLGDRTALGALVQELTLRWPRIDVLVNNAGVALGGSFAEATSADFEWLMGINFGAVVALTRGLLPSLLARPQAQVVNISSVFGLVGVPGNVAYCSAKFAVRGFSEALRHELAETSVGVTTVFPGGVKTAIARSARAAAGFRDAAARKEFEVARERFERSLVLSPRQAAASIVAGLERRRPRVLIGMDAHLLGWLDRLLPTRSVEILRRLRPSAFAGVAKSYQAMAQAARRPPPSEPALWSPREVAQSPREPEAVSPSCVG